MWLLSCRLRWSDCCSLKSRIIIWKFHRHFSEWSWKIYFCSTCVLAIPLTFPPLSPSFTPCLGAGEWLLSRIRKLLKLSVPLITKSSMILFPRHRRSLILCTITNFDHLFTHLYKHYRFISCISFLRPTTCIFLLFGRPSDDDFLIKSRLKACSRTNLFRNFRTYIFLEFFFN